MPSTFGIHRIVSGGEIAESTYDFDTQTIGPYRIPIALSYVLESNNGERIDHYRIYEELLNNPKAIAALNLNNYCIVVIEPTYIYEVNPFSKLVAHQIKLDLVHWNLPARITTRQVRKIGYIKSYGTCKAVSQYPYCLLQDLSTMEVIGFKEQLASTPVVEPPLQLYKELINSDAKAVYMDSVSGAPMFLKY